MVVESVNSVNNIPLTNNFVLPAQNTGSSAHSYKQPSQKHTPLSQPVIENMSVPQEVSAPVHPQQAKKGNKNVLWWVLGGLAVAGTAGILIYNLRKGKSTSSGANGSTLGDFAKKFADQSILTKTLERAQADGSSIQVQANADRSAIEVCDHVKCFGARVISKFENNAAGKVSEFDFANIDLEVNVVNFDNDLTRVGFLFDEMKNFVVKVDSKTGKVVQDLEGNIDGLGFLKPRAPKLVDDLDPKKLLDDDTYRTNYVAQVYQALRDATSDYHFDRIATASGKTIDEVKTVANGDEFAALEASKTWFDGIDKVFALGDSSFASSVAKSMDGCDDWTLLEKMMKGEVSHKVTANYTVDGLDFPKKNCFKIDLDDPIVPNEVIKLSDDGEYFSYCRRGTRSTCDVEDFFELELYRPKNMDGDVSNFTRLTTKDVLFSYKENADGLFDMVVKVDGKDVDVTEDVLATFKDKSFMESFLKEFVTKGKENITSLFSVS